MNDGEKKPVYNLTVTENHLYYAGGFLVHNCDATTQALSYLFFSNGIPASTKPNKQLEQARQAERAFLDNDSLYDVYGAGAS